VSGEILPAIGDFPAGSRIASYQIQELVGRGGMAVVYRAVDIRLDRSVALKILAPELARDDAFRQRFIRESRAGAAVDHPNVIPVFEAGEADDVLFIAMRYVTGRDVRVLIERNGQLPTARAVSIVMQVASALDAAHSHGLIHRDVKPANMLLATVSDGLAPDHVYLSDFGLSKQSVSSSSLTGTGQFLGTLDYMSPEQVEGRPIDGRTDLYALGCAAFEMLAGQPPFRREQNLAVMWAHVSAAPPSIRQSRPELPAAVDEVMAIALAKSPADRQASCLAFAAALRAACAIRPGSPPGLAGAAAPGAPLGPTMPPTNPPVSAAPPAPAVPVTASGLAVPPPRPGGPATELAQGVGQGQGHGQPGASAPGLDMTRTGFAPAGYPQSGYQQAGYQGGSVPPGHPPAWPPSGQPGYTDPQLSGGSGYPPAGPERRRGKGLPILLGCLVVLVLAGAAILVLHGKGLFGGHSSAPPSSTTTVTVSPSAGATPSTSASASGSPTVSQPVVAAPAGPARTVTHYYNAINNHRYLAAWRLNLAAHANESYADFKTGFAATQFDTLTITGVTGDVVSIQLAAEQTDGSVKNYQGTYTVQDGAIVASSIQGG
jgi:tRNA A-37 threonylcarbamoyl transferase component Bud32